MHWVIAIAAAAVCRGVTEEYYDILLGSTSVACSFIDLRLGVFVPPGPEHAKSPSASRKPGQTFVAAYKH